MMCNMVLVFWLFILPTLCVQLAEARAAVGANLQNRKRNVDDVFGDDVTKSTHDNRLLRKEKTNNGTFTSCFDAEPCQFGLYKRSHGRMYSFVLIPSWCVCSPTQKCAVDRYDQKKKAEIYTCQSQNQLRRVDDDSAQA